MAGADATRRQLRLALATQEFGLRTGLGRDAAVLARELVARGVEVHCYSDPARRTDTVDGVVFHDVRPATHSRGRLGHGVEYASFARAATSAVRRHRARYDVVQVNEG